MSDVIRSQSQLSVSSNTFWRSMGKALVKLCACLQPTFVNSPRAYAIGSSTTMASMKATDTHAANAAQQNSKTTTMTNTNLSAYQERAAFSARLAGAHVSRNNFGAFGAVAALAPKLAANNPALNQKAATQQNDKLRAATLTESEARLAFSERLAGLKAPINTAAFGAYANIAEMAQSHTARNVAKRLYEEAQQEHSAAVRNMQARNAFSERLAGGKSTLHTAALGEFAAVADFARQYAYAHNTKLVASAADKAKALEQLQNRIAFSELLAGAHTATAANTSAQSTNTMSKAIPANTSALGEFAAVAAFARQFSYAENADLVARAERAAQNEREAHLALAETIEQAAANAAQIQAESFVNAYGKSSDNKSDNAAAARAEAFIAAYSESKSESAQPAQLKSKEQRVAERWTIIIDQLSAPVIEHPIHLDAFDEQQKAA